MISRNHAEELHPTCHNEALVIGESGLMMGTGRLLTGYVLAMTKPAA